MSERIETVDPTEPENNQNAQILKLSEVPWREYLAEKNYSKNISTMCDECIAEQIEKYGRRTIPCKGLAEAKVQLGEDLYSSMQENLSTEEFTLTEAIYDPYAYMEEYLDAGNRGKPNRRFIRRWYQERIVKCVAEHTLVLMGDGSYRQIKDVKTGEKVVSFDVKNNSLPINTILNKWYSGEKKVFRLLLQNGDSIEITDDHPVLVSIGNTTGYSSISEGLGVGHTVFTVSEHNHCSILNTFKRFFLKSLHRKVTKTKIVAIIPLGYQATYDIEVSNHHNFIANNIVVHNCTAQSKVVRMGRRTGKTFALSVIIIHKMLTNMNYRILLVSPFQVQTDEIVDNIKTLCALLPENPITASRGAPSYTITFNTGSILKGFTASTDANSVRGQPGHLLVLDECLTGDTLISTPSGLKPIKDIQIGEKILTIVDGELVEDLVLDSQSTGVKNINTYTYSNGQSLKATPNHPVMTSSGWQPISEAQDILVFDSYSELVRKSENYLEEVFNLTTANTHTYLANGFLVHNCDDIPEKALVSIMGIKMDNPNVEIWRSGTPKGQLNLYKAEQDPASKSFHYPSFVIPHYDDALDSQLREELGEIGFVQEAMAEFGLVSNGVFQISFITKAQQRIEFINTENVLADRSRYIVIIGVDWNHDAVGTRIVVVAYDKFNPQFSIVEKAAIGITGYTQQAAMEKIIHLNRKYNCDHIFCDEGFGVTQIGDLKRVGEAAAGKVPVGHPDLKLMSVEGVNFASNTEIRDHMSGEVRKIPTKQFAVQNTVLMLERDLISLDPKRDNEMILQMKNYIEKYRRQGRIVYGYISKKIGDHDLDAFMIALYGFRVTYSSIFEGSVFQAMLKFANKTDTVDNTELQPSDYYGQESSLAHIKFSTTPKHLKSRTQKMGGPNPRGRRNI